MMMFKGKGKRHAQANQKSRPGKKSLWGATETKHNVLSELAKSKASGVQLEIRSDQSCSDCALILGRCPSAINNHRSTPEPQVPSSFPALRARRSKC